MMKKSLILIGWISPLIILLGLLLHGFFFKPPFAGEESRSASCKLNLKLIGLALVEYKNKRGEFPGPVIFDDHTGIAHSWRVELLEYLDDGDLYKSYQFDKPWDSAENAHFFNEWPDCYICPSDKKIHKNCTSYVMLVNKRADKTNRCADTAPKTIIITEIEGSDIHWAEPRDMLIDEMSFKINALNKPSISSGHPGGAFVLHCDGEIEFLSDKLTPEKVKELLNSP